MLKFKNAFLALVEVPLSASMIFLDYTGINLISDLEFAPLHAFYTELSISIYM